MQTPTRGVSSPISSGQKTFADRLREKIRVFEASIPDLWDKLLSPLATNGAKGALFSLPELMKHFKSWDGARSALKWLRRKGPSMGVHCEKVIPLASASGAEEHLIRWEQPNHSEMGGTPHSACE